MEEDAKILAVDAKFGAQFFAVGFVQKEALENAAIFLGEFGENLADSGLALLVYEGRVEIDTDVGEIGELEFGGGVFPLSAESFQQDVFRYGMDESWEAFDFGAAANVQDDAEKGFLTDVVDHLAGTKAEAEAGLQHTCKVRDEVSFGLWLLLFEAGQVVRIKRRLLHRRDRWNKSTSSPRGRGKQS